MGSGEQITFVAISRPPGSCWVFSPECEPLSTPLSILLVCYVFLYPTQKASCMGLGSCLSVHHQTPIV